jgi:hypothetical protein
MILHLNNGRWHIDVRGPGSSDQQSLDLSLHLPRRLMTGPVVVVTQNPKVFLSVIRKRWMRLLHEVEIQHSSTLDPLKRESLAREVRNMRSCQFSAKRPIDAPASTQVFFIKPDWLDDVPEHMTIYLATPLATQQVLQAMERLRAGGLIVIYGEWTADYEILLHQTYDAVYALQ